MNVRWANNNDNLLLVWSVGRLPEPDIGRVITQRCLYRVLSHAATKPGDAQCTGCKKTSAFPNSSDKETRDKVANQFVLFEYKAILPESDYM